MSLCVVVRNLFWRITYTIYYIILYCMNGYYAKVYKCSLLYIYCHCALAVFWPHNLTF